MSNYKTRFEILAPAGGEEQLTAALRSGANAVYFGATGFNARRNAANFGDDDFINAVRQCHLRGVKAYITLNTLIKDSEKEDMEKTLRLIAESGADAVIVQDMSVVKAVKQHCPSLPLHASTQMAVHNTAGAKLLERMGFARIVLAREMSLAEITAVCKSVNAEIEVFVHGAHCMSASGMCYMSSALGARSGNRGLCAQPCRLDFKSGSREYALSLKDMSLIEHIDELDKAGVSSFKIEGRMKRPEYVAAAVRAVKQKIDGEKPDTDTLKSVFSRSGFTDGYLTGRRTVDMFGHRTKEDVVSASGVLPSLAALYKDERKCVGVHLSARIKKGEKSELILSDGENTVKVYGDEPQTAMHLPLTKEMCAKSLLKFGGTPFDPLTFECEIDDGIMLPAAALNALRRSGVDELSNIRENSVRREYTDGAEKRKAVSTLHGGNSLRLSFERADSIPDNINCEKLFLPVREINKNPELIARYGERLVPIIPVLLYPKNEEKISARLKAFKESGIVYALCENIGAVEIALGAGLVPLGGAMLNVLNSDAVEMYSELGVRDITLSTEMSFTDMKNIRAECKIGYVAYGHVPLMRFRCCPMQTERGCAGCSGDSVLTDRRGNGFRVLCSDREYSTLYNMFPLYTGGMSRPETDFNVLCFTYETKEECEKVIKAFVNGEKADFKRTAGLYDKELL